LLAVCVTSEQKGRVDTRPAVLYKCDIIRNTTLGVAYVQFSMSAGELFLIADGYVLVGATFEADAMVRVEGGAGMKYQSASQTAAMTLSVAAKTRKANRASHPAIALRLSNRILAGVLHVGYGSNSVLRAFPLHVRLGAASGIPTGTA
jgi:hypothetical protein